MNIIVKQTSQDPNYSFEVTVDEGSSSTRHFVSMTKDFYENLDTNSNPEQIIHESFLFLLSKESKEMIYSEFDVSIISSYYPDFLDYLNNKV